MLGKLRSHSRVNGHHGNVLSIADSVLPDSRIVTTHFYADSIVHISMFGTDIGCLVDSGASISCIKLSLLNKLSPSCKNAIRSTNFSFRTASGSALKPIGTIVLNFSLGNTICHIKFWVFDHLNQDVILGRDFLQKYHAVIDYSNKTVSFRGRVSLSSAHEHMLKPHETCLVAAVLEDTKCITPTGLHGLVHGRSHSSGLNIEDTVCTVANGCVPILVKNVTSAPIKVTKGQFLSTFVALNESECVRIGDVSSRECDFVNINTIKTAEPLPFNFTKTNCNEHQLHQLKKCLANHHDAFMDSSGRIGKCDLLPHDIKLKPGTVPIVKMPYRVSPETRAEIEKQIQDYIDQDVITPIESEWASPLLVVKKGVKKSRKHLSKPGRPEVRMCIDYRYLNSQTIYSKIEIPRIGDLVDTVGMVKPKFFSLLDLRHGFFQQTLTPSSVPLTAFLWNGQSYAFKRTPMGLSGSPMSFQRLVNKILKPFLGVSVVAYLDDILIYTNKFSEHVDMLGKVLNAITKAGLKLHPTKCTFATKQCDFLGHSLSSQGITISKDHVRSIESYPRPENVKEVRTFVGLVQFFKDYIPQRPVLTAPLTALTKKNAVFKWTNECQEAFDKLKSILSSQPVLQYPDYNKRFYVITDASVSGIGGVLCHKNSEGIFRPIAFTGRATSLHEKNATTTELECLACVYCVTKWEVYLTGREFTLITDHHSLQYILGKNNKLSPKLSRWALYLSQFQYTVEYRKGLLNGAADAMSRRYYDFDHTSEDDKIDRFPDIDIISGQENSLHEEEAISAITRAQAKQIRSDMNESTDVTETASDMNSGMLTQSCGDNGSDSVGSNAKLFPKIKPSKSPLRHTISADVQQEIVNDLWDDSDCFNITKSVVATHQRQDEFCNDLIRYLEHDELPASSRRQRKCILREHDYSVIDGILYHIWMPIPSSQDRVFLRLVIPKDLQYQVIKAVHSTALGAHVGIQKVISLIKPRFSWPGMYNMVRKFINNCDACQLAKNTHKTQKTPRTLFDIAEMPFHRIHVDFCGPYTMSSNQNRYICTVVDSLSGYLITWPCRNIKTETFALQFFHKVICVFGCPSKIVTDRGAQFTSHLWKELGRLLGINMAMTAGYHPQANGMAEVRNRDITNLLRTLTSQDPKNWDRHLPAVTFALNNSVHSAFGLTPFNVIFGRDAVMPLDINTSELENRPMNEVIGDILKFQEKAKSLAMRLHAVRDERLKSEHDKNVKMLPITSGSIVFWNRPSLADPSENRKLQNPYFGPYVVVERHVGNTVTMKNLQTGKVLPHRISITQLKVPTHYRKMSPSGKTGVLPFYAPQVNSRKHCETPEL